MQRLNQGGWVVSLNPMENPKVRLLCFAYEGGSAECFSSWIPLLRSGVELLGVELPGHGCRADEPPLCTLEEIIEGMISDAGDLLCKPLIVFGHGLGGILAYEWLSHLTQTGSPLPKRLVVSACQSPSDSQVYFPKMSHLDDQDFFEDLVNDDCLSQRVLTAPEEVADCLDSIRADYEIRESYLCRHQTVLNIPVEVFAGSRDKIPLGNLLEWQQVVRQPVHVCVFKGGHCFVEEDKQSVLNHLNELCDEVIVTGAYA